MSPEDTTSPELESMRQQVEQELDANWQKEITKNPSLAEDSPEVFFEGEEDIDPTVRSKYEKEFRAHKISRFFNNFHGHLPGPFNKRTILTIPDLADKTPKETGEAEEDYSPRKYTKTFRQFYEDIDKARELAGYSEEELAKVQEAAFKSRSDIESYIKQQEALFDIFVQLRLMGYNSSDLKG